MLLPSSADAAAQVSFTHMSYLLEMWSFYHASDDKLAERV